MTDPEPMAGITDAIIAASLFREAACVHRDRPESDLWLASTLDRRDDLIAKLQALGKQDLGDLEDGE